MAVLNRGLKDLKVRPAAEGRVAGEVGRLPEPLAGTEHRPFEGRGEGGLGSP